MSKSFGQLLLIVVLFSFSGLIFISSCKKENNTNPGPSPAGISTTVSGIVTDIYGNPIAGAEIINETRTAVSGPDGKFILKNGSFTNNKCFLTVKKQGYISNSRWVNGLPQDGNTAITLEAGTTFTIDAGTGGNISLPGGCSISFPAAAFEYEDGQPCSGNITVQAAHISPDDDNFSLRIPGGNLLAKTNGGKDVILYSFGMLSAEITGSNGNKAVLKSGSSATISIPIATSQSADAPATLPLWHLDETTGLWKEEGTATRTGNVYTGTVSHFSSWNVDKPMPIAFIEGKVEDCAKKPVKNIPVIIGQIVTYTDDGGNFHTAVPAEQTLEGVISSPFSQSFFKKFSIKLKENETYNPGVIPVDCTVEIYGFIKDCNNEPFAGELRVIMSNNTGSITKFIDSGVFSISVPKIDTSFTLSILSAFTLHENKSLKLNITPSTHSLNLGTIDACDPTQTYYFQEATFDGDGLNNKKIRMPIAVTPYPLGFGGVNYFNTDNINRYNWPHPVALPISAFVLHFSYTGNSIKNINFQNSDSLNTLTLVTGESFYKPISGSFQIIKRGDFTQMLPFEALFEGTFGRYNNTTGALLGTINVTNGKVVSLRGSDLP